MVLLLYGWVSPLIGAQPGSNNSSLFHREMIEHCLNCYGKRYTENGKTIYEDSKLTLLEECHTICHRAGLTSLYPPPSVQTKFFMHYLRIKCVGAWR